MLRYIYSDKNAEKAAANDECAICDGKKKINFWSQCEDCNKWYHPKCLGLDEKVIKALPKDKPFHCPDCRPTARSTNATNLDDNLIQVEQRTSQTPGPSNAIEKERANTSGTTNSSQGTVIDQENLIDLASRTLSIQEHSSRKRIKQIGIALRSRKEQQIRSNAKSNKARQISGRGEPSTKGKRPTRHLNKPPHSKPHMPPTPGTEFSSDSETSTDSEGNDTDSEGYAAVKKFKDHDVEDGKRIFQAVFEKNNEERWVFEEDCDGCIDVLNKYCRETGLPESSVTYKEGCGAVANRVPNKKIWVKIERIEEAAIIYGNKKAIQPRIFNGLNPNEDSLQLMQVASHCFVLLYLSSNKTCYVADGQNAFAKQVTSRNILLSKLKGVRFVTYLPFYGQKEEDQCASSAAAISIEFQRLYHGGLTPEEPLQVPRTILKRIRSSFHKESGEKINRWSPVDGEVWKVQCSQCGKKFNTKNRGALNLHRCS